MLRSTTLLAIGVSVGKPTCDRLRSSFSSNEHSKVRRDQSTDAEPNGQAKNRGCQQGPTLAKSGSGNPCGHWPCRQFESGSQYCT
jgi:hypothetical protein